ncbi:MAG: DUF134 domain-containing protein [Thermoplasmata archaeon]|nr:DUF134 domain-containing protein [Thermoplasmata archaeon]
MPGRRGRHRCPRWVTDVPEVQFFKPAGVPLRTLQVIELTVDELETLRLVDIEGLTQEDASVKMGISRRTFWNDLMSARRKVAFALVNGQAIQIRGGAYSVAGTDEERRKKICQTEMEQDPGAAEE